MVPTPENPASTSAALPSWRRDLWLLALAFGLLYAFRLGSYPLSNPDEGRNAEIAREMLATGDWITPRLNGVNYFEKPPLVYWVTAASEAIFGLNEWAVRAVPALFAVWGVLLTYRAGRRLYGREAGLASAVVLGTTLLWFAIGHIPILDMAVSMLMARALFRFIQAVNAPDPVARRRHFIHLYASMGLATLAKGLIGFLVTGAVMFLWLLIFHQWKRLRPLHLAAGALLFLAIAAPWHLLVARANETWVHRYFVYEHFERFLTSAASRPGPWHYFVWIVIAGMIPWTGFLWPAVRDALRGGWARRDENRVAWFLMTWVGFVFFFLHLQVQAAALHSARVSGAGAPDRRVAREARGCAGRPRAAAGGAADLFVYQRPAGGGAPGGRAQARADHPQPGAGAGAAGAGGGDGGHPAGGRHRGAVARANLRRAARAGRHGCHDGGISPHAAICRARHQQARHQGARAVRANARPARRPRAALPRVFPRFHLLCPARRGRRRVSGRA
jgi:hypothetical protein